MKRKLIEVNQEYLITCDNEKCDYKIKNLTGDPNVDTSEYLNVPCPNCGENLLTEQDHIQSLKVLKIINWVNKWFSWTTFFASKKTTAEKSVYVHVHKGLNIQTEDPANENRA